MLQQALDERTRQIITGAQQPGSRFRDQPQADSRLSLMVHGAASLLLATPGWDFAKAVINPVLPLFAWEIAYYIRISTFYTRFMIACWISGSRPTGTFLSRRMRRFGRGVSVFGFVDGQAAKKPGRLFRSLLAGPGIAYYDVAAGEGTLVEPVVAIAILGMPAATATPMVNEFPANPKEQAYVRASLRCQRGRGPV